MKEVVEVFSAFADNEEDVEVGADGTLLYRRFSKDRSCRITEDADGNAWIEEDGAKTPYRRYIALNLGQLDVFAQKLLEDRAPEISYVDGEAQLESVYAGNSKGSGLDLLDSQCRDQNAFASRLIFITADAGHGKTALLRRYQFDTALKFNQGASPFLFWHVDLQGRQLVRLSEALMGDLGELRITGLYMPSVLTLIRLRLLVLAIDGFDELAAEQGTTDALGALRVMLEQMRGRGAIVAASRRTFFSTDNYTRRAKLVNPVASARAAEFNEIRLLPWSKTQAVAYLEKAEFSGNSFSSGEEAYAGILNEIGQNTEHPILATPFLLSHVAKGMLLYNTSPSEFVGGMSDPIHGVPAVVEAFVKREVTDKWKSKETGEPYLSVDQHMAILAAVAEELWQNQVDRLSVDILEAITSILLEDWSVDQSRQVQIHEMVRMHVLLHRPVDSRGDSRGFEHPEFQNYFLARALTGYIDGSSTNKDRLRELLSIGQISDSVARYAAMLLHGEDRPVSVVDLLCELVTREWRPTHLQSNAGTFLPYFLDGRKHDETLCVTGKVVFSSLVFEGISLENVEFNDCTFLQTRLTDVHWKEVTLRNCKLYEVVVGRDAQYENVKWVDCSIEGISLEVKGEEVFRAFSDERIGQLASQCSIQLESSEKVAIAEEERTGLNKLASKLLRVFGRTTTVSEDVVRMRFSQKAPEVLKNLIPLMLKYDQLIQVEWKGGGNKEAWQLTRPIDAILRDDNGQQGTDGEKFWHELNK